MPYTLEVRCVSKSNPGGAGMSYIVEAFIASREVMHFAVHSLPGARLVLLPQWLSLVPNTNNLFEREDLGPGSGVPSSLWQLAEFSPQAYRWMKDASAKGPIGYIEVHFFGGIGKQVAFLMDKGQITLGPLITIRRNAQYRMAVEGERYGAVNSILAQLGVERQGGKDEFDTIGLNRFRSTQEWDQDLADFTG